MADITITERIPPPPPPPETANAPIKVEKDPFNAYKAGEDKVHIYNENGGLWKGSPLAYKNGQRLDPAQASQYIKAAHTYDLRSNSTTDNKSTKGQTDSSVAVESDSSKSNKDWALAGAKNKAILEETAKDLPTALAAGAAEVKQKSGGTLSGAEQKALNAMKGNVFNNLFHQDPKTAVEVARAEFKEDTEAGKTVSPDKSMAMDIMDKDMKTPLTNKELSSHDRFLARLEAHNNALEKMQAGQRPAGSELFMKNFKDIKALPEAYKGTQFARHLVEGSFGANYITENRIRSISLPKKSTS